MRFQRVEYTIKPLMANRVWQKNKYLVADNKGVDFWTFLSKPFLFQLECLAFSFLKKRGAIRFEVETIKSLEFKEFYTESIYETVALHVEGFYNAFGEFPSKIFVGQDIHKQLFYSPEIRYQQDVQCFNLAENKIYVENVEVVLVRHLQGFFLLS